MTPDTRVVLQALYDCERPYLETSRFDIWTDAAQVSSALPQEHPRRDDAAWVRAVLEELWRERKVLQIPSTSGDYELVDVELRGGESFVAGPSRIPVEKNDCRGDDDFVWEQVAVYGPQVPTRYRSRVAEIARLLSLNYQRFRMLPSTGMLRYERRAQLRPEYSIPLDGLSARLVTEITSGVLSVGEEASYRLRDDVNRTTLSKAATAVLEALADMFVSRGAPPASQSSRRGLSELVCVASTARTTEPLTTVK